MGLSKIVVKKQKGGKEPKLGKAGNRLELQRMSKKYSVPIAMINFKETTKAGSDGSIDHRILLQRPRLF